MRDWVLSVAATPDNFLNRKQIRKKTFLQLCGGLDTDQVESNSLSASCLFLLCKGMSTSKWTRHRRDTLVHQSLCYLATLPAQAVLDSSHHPIQRKTHIQAPVHHLLVLPHRMVMHRQNPYFVEFTLCLHNRAGMIRLKQSYCCLP